MVNPKGFAYAAQPITEKGHLVVVQKMSFCLPTMAPIRCSAVRERYPDVYKFVMMGYSQGVRLPMNF
ncbi:MAG: alpha/beta hydrolase [Acetanaerobacterium sp.]